MATMSKGANSLYMDPFIPALPVPEGQERISTLNETFYKRFNTAPHFYVRVPGRVNLIGEHIDYCGYGVLPMALEQDILVAVATSENFVLSITNQEKDKAPDFECDIRNFEINVAETGPKWYQYFLCGVKGILEQLPESVPVTGFLAAVNGTIPQGAGLSSSSALVGAAALATAKAHKLSLSREKLADISAKCERYIGTQGGGMDQAIAFLATEGCAKLIDFNPLRSRDVTLPRNAVFVIAHSQAFINKAATADFNCRVIECRLASQIIAKKQGLSGWQELKKLGDLHKALNVSLEDMVELVKKCLHEQPYSKEEVLEELQVDADLLERISLTPNTRHVQSFQLHRRALHVFQESLRVSKFYQVCCGGGGGGDDAAENPKILETLGKLMLESHRSLKDLYECSHPQLDRIVELSKDLTLGVRLTGAGWGGCVVALVRPENADAYVKLIKDKFYREELGMQDDMDRHVFSTEPKGGACVYAHC